MPFQHIPCRHDFGAPQEAQDEEADGKRPPGGALGKDGKGDEQRNDAPQRLVSSA